MEKIAEYMEKLGKKIGTSRTRARAGRPGQWPGGTPPPRRRRRRRPGARRRC